MKSKFVFLALIVVLVSGAFAPFNLPSRPGLIFPVSNTLVTDPDAVILKWNKSSPTSSTIPPSSLLSYEVEVSTGPGINSFTGSFLNLVNIGPGTSTVTGNSWETYPITTGLDYGKTYYWHVRAFDDYSSLPSSWSATGMFRVAVEPPTFTGTNVIDSPDYTLRPKVTWTPGKNVSQTQSYTIQMSIERTFSTIIYRTITVSAYAVPANQYIFTSDLPAGTTYYWRIRANSTLGASEWEPNVKLDPSPTPVEYETNTPPTIPVLASPANNSVVNDGTPTLTWKAPVSSLDTFYTYQIAFYKSLTDVSNNKPDRVLCVANPVSIPPVSIPATSSYTHPCTIDVPDLGDQQKISIDIPASAPLTSATSYYWRMRAVRTDGTDYEHSGWSSLWLMKIGIVGTVDTATMNPGEITGNVPGITEPVKPPDVPPVAIPPKNIDDYFKSPTNPGNLLGYVQENVNLLSLRPTFTWEKGALAAQSFVFQLASSASYSCNIQDPNASTFATTIVNTTVPILNLKYKPTTDLPAKEVLCWRLRPYHATYGYGQWSDVQIFKTANPPSVPSPTSPVSGTLTNDNSPAFDWTTVEGTTVSDPDTEFGKYEVEISFRSDFVNNYPANKIPPYSMSTIVYADVQTALDLPIEPDEMVSPPVQPLVKPNALCPLYPSIDQAHDPVDELANTREESYFQMHEEPSAPVGTYGTLCGVNTYYWRVRAYNNLGEYSAWSSSRSIRITPDRPEGLVVKNDASSAALVSPIVPNSPRPFFDWDDVPGASSYTLYIATNPTFLSGQVQRVDVYRTSQVQLATDLPKGKTLYWKVIADSPGLAYGRSLVGYGPAFVSANPPTTPVLSLPLTNTFSSPTVPPNNFTFTFTWKPSLFVPDFSLPDVVDFDHYEIAIAENSAFTVGVITDSTPIAGSIYDTTISKTLDPMKTYYWRVRSCNNVVPQQCSTWSLPYIYRTIIEAPILDSLVPPVDSTPTFNWAASVGASYYYVGISRYDSCYPYIVSASVPATAASTYTWKSTKSLISGIDYYWCVRAYSTYYRSNIAIDPAAFQVP